MNNELVAALMKECLKQIHTLGLPSALSVRDSKACVLGYFKALQVEAATILILMNAKEPDMSLVQALVSASFRGMREVLEREGSSSQSIVGTSGTDAPIPASPQGELEQGEHDRDSLGHTGP